MTPDVFRLRRVAQVLHVDTVGLRKMAGNWGGSVSELDETPAPAGLGMSRQGSAAAVSAAHVAVAAFTAGLSARVGQHAIGVAQANTRYLIQETVSATGLAALAPPTIGM